MAERKINEMVQGMHTTDGAGVHLVRVLGHNTVNAFDPFLMLDSFDSQNPDDYIAGFPFHPHRGIETITYLISGEIDHMDSLGNRGRIGPGQSQWMTAGSGIMHQEMPKASGHMLGLQLWLNLPKEEKMCEPQYFDITGKMIGTLEEEDATVRVISGQYKDVKGASPSHIAATIMDVDVKAGHSVSLPTTEGDNVSIFLIVGDAEMDGQLVAEKTAVNFGPGDSIRVKATAAGNARFIFLSAKPLGEAVAWGGPIVMNTREELQEAFKELGDGTFIKHRPAGHVVQ